MSFVCSASRVQLLNENPSRYEAFNYGEEHVTANLLSRVGMIFFLTCFTVGILGIAGTMPSETVASSASLIAIGSLGAFGVGYGIKRLYEAKWRLRFAEIKPTTCFWNVSTTANTITPGSSHGTVIKLGMEYGSARFLAGAFLIMTTWTLLIGVCGTMADSTLISSLGYGFTAVFLIGSSTAFWKLNKIKKHINEQLGLRDNFFICDIACAILSRL